MDHHSGMIFRPLPGVVERVLKKVHAAPVEFSFRIRGVDLEPIPFDLFRGRATGTMIRSVVEIVPKGDFIGKARAHFSSEFGRESRNCTTHCQACRRLSIQERNPCNECREYLSGLLYADYDRYFECRRKAGRRWYRRNHEAQLERLLPPGKW